MLDRTPKMLVFPDLGSQVEDSQLTQRLRMSVEQHTLPGIPKQVNIFLDLYVSLPITVQKQWPVLSAQWPAKNFHRRGAGAPSFGGCPILRVLCEGWDPRTHSAPPTA